MYLCVCVFLFFLPKLYTEAFFIWLSKHTKEYD
jgi:hypothetical protein